MNKLLLYIGLVLLTLTSVSAINDPVIYHTFDDDDLTGSDPDDLSGNDYHSTNNGATTGTTGLRGEAFDLDGSADYVLFDDTGSDITGNMTISMWFKDDGLSSQQILVGRSAGTHSTTQYQIQYYSGTLYASVGAGGSTYSATTSVTSKPSDWQHVVMTVCGDTVQVYLDNVAGTSATKSGAQATYTEGGIGARVLGGTPQAFYNGEVDDLLIYDRCLTTGEIEQLYGNGSGVDPLYVAPEVAYGGNITIPINTIFNMSPDSNASYIASENISADNVLTTSGDTLTIDGTNFSKTPSTPTTWSLHGLNISHINVVDFEDNVLSNYTIYYSATGVSGNYTHNSSHVFDLVFTNETYRVVVVSDGYSSYDEYIDMTGREELNVTLYPYYDNYFYFYNGNTNTPITDANITIDLPRSTTDLELVTDVDGKVEFSSIYENVPQNGTYNITFEDLSGFITPITFTRDYSNYSSFPVNESFNISVTNLNITLYYRSNSSLFNKNASVIIEGLANHTTTNGTIYIQNSTIAAGTYRVTVSSDGYYNEEKTFTYTSQDSIDVSLYLLELNASNSGTVTIRTVDEYSRLLDNVEVNLLEYDPSTLSYIEVSECYTDSNGECKFLVETNTKSYKFTASKDIGTSIITASTNAQIFEDDISGGETVVFSEETITLTLSSQETYGINVIQNIIYNISESFNETTNISNIDVSFRSIDGTNLEVCVEYFEVVSGVETSKTGDTFCVVAASAEVTENAYFTLNRSKDYIAKVYIKTDSGNVLLESFKYNSNTSFEQMLINNATLPFFILFLWVLLIGGSLMLKNVPLTGVAITVGAWVLLYIFPSILLTSVAVLQTLIGISLVYIGRKKEDFD